MDTGVHTDTNGDLDERFKVGPSSQNLSLIKSRTSLGKDPESGRRKDFDG